MKDQITVVSNSTPAPQAVESKGSVNAESNANEELEQQNDSTDDSEAEENSGEESEGEQDSDETDEENLESEDSGDSDSEDDQEKIGEEKNENTEGKKKKLGGFQKKLMKLQTELSERDRKLAFLEGQLSNGKKADTEIQEQQAVVDTTGAPEEPNPDNFKSVGEYLKAMVVYNNKLVDYKLDQSEKSRLKKIEDQTVATEHTKKVTKFNESLAATKKSTKDFDTVLASVNDVNLQPVLQMELVNSDLGGKLMYELSKNKKELIRINGLAPHLIGREIAKFEAKIELTLAAKKLPPKKTTSSADAPITPLRGSATVGKKTIYDADISQAEYERLRNEK